MVMSVLAALFALYLAVTTASAQVNQSVFAQTNQIQAPPDITNENMAVMQHVEELRAICIKNRRMICGRILQILPEGIVVDSGYTNLMRAPLNRSWLIPGTAAAERAANIVEQTEPDAICLGQVFLTDLPKAPPNRKLKEFDFVVLEGFPMGKYTYVSAANVPHTVRKFSTKVTTAVRWMSGQEVDAEQK